MIRQEANIIAKNLNIINFTASSVWIVRFRKHNVLVYRRVCGESAAIDINDVESWIKNILPKILAGYGIDDVYNADEFELLFSLLPDRTMTLRADNYYGGKRSKERLTVLLCCNASESNKLSVLVIGKSAKPCFFKNARSFPCAYKNQKKAWMTGELFKECLVELDKKNASSEEEDSPFH